MFSGVVINGDRGTFTRLYTLHKLYPNAKIILKTTRKEIDLEYIDWLRKQENI